MRLWSLHPRYFDRQALTAGWREALLAQAVLTTPGRGYSNHPQLERFRESPRPLDAIGMFLAGLVDEADARGYRFDRSKIRFDDVAAGASAERGLPAPVSITVTTGQLDFEWAHLLAKLERRSPEVATRWIDVREPLPHPLFELIDGPIAAWERGVLAESPGGR